MGLCHEEFMLDPANLLNTGGPMFFSRREFTAVLIRILMPALVLLGAALQISPLSPFRLLLVAAQTSSTQDVGVEGWVKDANTSAPVEDARITINDSLQAISGGDGYFSFSTSQLAAAGIAASPAGQPVRVSVRAEGRASWSISNAGYYNGSALRLYPVLNGADGPDISRIAGYNSAASQAPDMAKGFSVAPPNTGSVLSDGNSGQAGGSIQSAGLTVPATIRVYRSASGTVEVVSFRDYLKHVLPNEWIPTWSTASLQAGAMAVKSYAWYWVSSGGKQAALGADVKDNTDDQVYDPNISYSTTDAAVDATYQYAMTISGSLFQAQYCAGRYGPDPTGDCPWQGPYMTQWGSSYHSDQGRSWSWIVRFYYPGVVISPSPPGAGSDGTPIAVIPSRPPPTAVSASFTVGQGSDNPQVYKDAYERNGGAQSLGKPLGPVRWWLTYVSENNVQAQAFSGPDGKGNTWLVYDVLKSATLGIQSAYVLSGSIATAYSTHNPPGPEWVGAPTSDAYTSDKSAGGNLSQGFARGTLFVAGETVLFTPWPQSFANWKSEWYVGHQSPGPQSAPALDLPGQPALVRDVAAPDMQWDKQAGKAGSYGVGLRDWSVQFTRDFQAAAGTYDFTLTANSGARLWVDGMLAVNGWQWAAPSQADYSVDLAAGLHRIRVQYFSLDSSAQLAFKMGLRAPVVATPPPPAATAVVLPTQAAQTNDDSLAQLRVRVTWLGRPASPDDSWVQPLTLQLTTPGNPTPVGTYKGTTDRNGVAFYSGLPSGTFDVHVKGPHSLQSARAAIALTAQGVVDLDMKTQVEGDIDGDNCVTIGDFSLVQAQLGLRRGMADFRPAADLNNDGEVNLADVSLLRSGFDRCGDVSADASFTTMSSENAPTLAQSLAPWLAPDRLQRGLGLSVVPSGGTAKVGQIVEAQVVADTGSQAVDGGAFVLKYDPAILAPVDANGNPATGALPSIALPSVMGNWIDRTGGAVGYSAGMLQGQPPQGQVVVARLRFKVLAAPQWLSTNLSFASAPSGYMQLTNGGVNLLGKAVGTTLTITP